MLWIFIKMATIEFQVATFEIMSRNRREAVIVKERNWHIPRHDIDRITASFTATEILC